MSQAVGSPYRQAIAVKRRKLKLTRRWAMWEELLLECGHIIVRRPKNMATGAVATGAYCTVCPQTRPIKLIPDDFCHVCFHPGHGDRSCTADDYDPFLDVGSVNCGCEEMTTRAQRNAIEVIV